MSPQQRSLAMLRDLGYRVAIVEHWNAHARRRVDLFGLFDLLALRPDGPPIGIQVTSGTNVAARLDKLRASEALTDWLACGCKAQVHGWAKRGPRGQAKRWECRCVEVGA